MQVYIRILNCTYSHILSFEDRLWLIKDVYLNPRATAKITLK